MTGLFAILEELFFICKEWNIIKGKCTIYCDGLSALNKVEQCTYNNISTRSSNFDLLSACVKLKESIPITLNFQHVKAHQDTHQQYSSLSLESQLNVIMDGPTKDFLDTAQTIQIQTLQPPTWSAPLPTYQGHYILDNVQENLYTIVSNQRAHEYWISKSRYTTTTRSLICWTSQLKAQKIIQQSRRHFVCKWSSGWLGTGRNMERWKLRYSGNCPFCDSPEEHTTHILQYNQEKPTIAWKQALADWKKKLTTQKTSAYLLRAIIFELKAWRFGTTLQTVEHCDHQLQEVILEQR